MGYNSGITTMGGRAGGGARGGGKSWFVRWKAVLLCSNYAGIKVLITRKTFRELLNNHIAPLIGMLMMGNLFKETGVTDRLSDTVQNALMNIVTILLSTAVGATMVGETFLTAETLKIIVLGVVAFGISTAGGLLGGNVMCKLTGKKVNPLIGSAGVSAVPMAARVSNMVGQKNNPSNFLLMHAMGPNVAGVIGSAIAAGFLLSVFG